MMPTAAKLVAAILLGALAWGVSDLIRPLMPEGTNFGWFNYVNAAVGAILGWRIIGAQAGKGMGEAMSMGFTASVVLYLLGLFIQACNEMLRLATSSRFDGPIEAVQSILTIGMKYASEISSPLVIVSLAVGGVVVGILTEYASRRWR